MISTTIVIVTTVISLMLSPVSHKHPGSAQAGTDTTHTYTYEKDVAPIIQKYCISCHGSDNMNPSDLYMDDFATLMKGGKHGVPVVLGNPEKSALYFKLLPDPPFGKQMPRGHKKITPEAVQIIHDWIQEGAKEK
jgi:Planctomycete cytochrome C